MELLTCFLVFFASQAFAAPLNISEPISPSFDAQRDVRLLLLTRQNRNNPYQLQVGSLNSIQQSPFNPSKPLRFLIHGWFEDESFGTIDIAQDLLDLYDFNVIFVEWPGSINYAETRRRIPFIGTLVANYIDFLHENSFADFRRITIIGTSLGAHISGHVGKFVRRGRINTIVGLDPGGLLYTVEDSSNRLDAGDAEYVEAIHTNGGPGNLGIGAPIAHADFFPNGGSSQPGCITDMCSHARAVFYYMESLRRNGFYAARCANFSEAQRGLCRGTPGAWLGGEPSNHNKSLRGIFWLETNRREPFAIGPVKP